MADTRTYTLPVLPLQNGVIGPQMVVTIAAESPEARHAADDAAKAERRVLLVPRVEGGYAKVGTVAVIEQDGELPGGQRALVVRGIERASLGAGRSDLGQALWVEVEPTRSDVVSTPEVDQLVREYRVTVEAILEHRGARQVAEAITQIHDPSAVADLALYSPDLSFEQKVQVLETIDVEARLRLVLDWMKDTLADLTVRDELRRNLEEDLSKEQREAVLRRQLGAIQKELDDGEGGDDLVAGYRAKLEASGAPEAVAAAVAKELDKLARTSTQNPEHGWIVSWLDTIFELPWSNHIEDNLDLEAARAVLDADHAGLDKVKDRIVEYLAIRKLRHDRGVDAASEEGETARRSGQGTIVALVGPPGVGKTSLGASIARALGRPFARVALGGVHDEAEIRGHRRTYVGARPGRFVRALTEAGAMNPVLLLDEVDKVGSDYRGDPSAALLEVLDPAQNHTFRDHYLEVDLDLSDVIFLATANQLDTIPGPLLDRLEIVGLEGYVEDEKVAIARHHLLPRLLTSSGIRPEEVIVTDGALRAVVADHTREAGVRELERQLTRILRKLATRLATTTPVDGDGTVGIVVDQAMVVELLGKPRFHEEVAERTSSPGVVTGLAVTGAGGGILFIEAQAMDGEPGLTLTGQLGDVMKESAEIARSFIRANKASLGLEGDDADKKRIHIHVPAGATPKDGPSAGVAMTTALVSLLSGRPVKPTVGMTGEVTLQGKVLPIGGVRQKLLAAHRAGLTEVILPARNEADLDDVPEAVRNELTIHLASDVRDVIRLALTDPA